MFISGQLSLWYSTAIDLTAKIKAEREAGVGVFYHFCGKPLELGLQGTRWINND